MGSAVISVEICLRWFKIPGKIYQSKQKFESFTRTVILNFVDLIYKNPRSLIFLEEF